MHRRAVARAAALAAASGLAAFALCELAVRWHVEGGLGPALASLVEGPGRGGALGRAGGEGDFLPDQELGYRLNPARAGIDARGYRGPPVADEPAAGTLRVIVLGDSVAFGEDGFADRLRASLPARAGGAVELVNASVPGYTTHQERRFYEVALAGVRADLVLLQYCANDNHEFLYRIDAGGRRLATPEAKRALIPEGSDPWSRFSRWSYAVVEIRRRLWMRALGRSSRFPWDAREDFAPAWRDASWGAFERELLALRDAAAARGARLGLIAFPLEAQLEPDLIALDRAYVLAPERHQAEIAGRAGVPFLDLWEPFRAARERGERLYTDGIHLTESGHALAAGEIEGFLLESGLVEAAPAKPVVR